MNKLSPGHEVLQALMIPLDLTRWIRQIIGVTVGSNEQHAFRRSYTGHGTTLCSVIIYNFFDNMKFALRHPKFVVEKKKCWSVAWSEKIQFFLFSALSTYLAVMLNKCPARHSFSEFFGSILAIIQLMFSLSSGNTSIEKSLVVSDRMTSVPSPCHLSER